MEKNSYKFEVLYSDSIPFSIFHIQFLFVFFISLVPFILNTFDLFLLISFHLKEFVVVIAAAAAALPLVMLMLRR